MSKPSSNATSANITTIAATSDSPNKRPISPCQGICGYVGKEYCQGCFRTPDEISNWFFMKDDEKWQVIERVTPLIAAKYQK